MLAPTGTPCEWCRGKGWKEKTIGGDGRGEAQVAVDCTYCAGTGSDLVAQMRETFEALLLADETARKLKQPGLGEGLRWRIQRMLQLKEEPEV